MHRQQLPKPDGTRNPPVTPSRLGSAFCRNKTCPAFIGKVRHRLHIGFEDPSETIGEEQTIMDDFRRIRDQIKEHLPVAITEKHE